MPGLAPTAAQVRAMDLTPEAITAVLVRFASDPDFPIAHIGITSMTQGPTLSLLLPFLLIVLTAGCGEQSDRQPAAPDTGAEVATPATESAIAAIPAIADAAPGTVPELEWDDLIPADWQPEKLMADYDADSLTDDDPRADELMDKLKALWAEAPVVQALDGQRLRLPGFVVPLETDATEITEFLLVPYFGACIHVPPPPANQTVHVLTADGAAYQGELFDTVWVEGIMRVEQFSNDLGDAGYRLEDAEVSPYDDEG
jgi:hypothetical protein